ncbi:MAG: hypothetical protein ACREN7_04390 [Candidatus Dormibacteria bacterium]
MLAALALTGATAAYLGFVLHFGVNVPFKDEWSSVKLYQDLLRGRLSLGALWALHNENRIFFPNLLMLLLDRASRFNTVVEMVVSAVLLLAAVAGCAYVLLRTAPRRGIWFLAALVIPLSWLQSATALQGYAVALYLVLLCLALALVALFHAPARSWLFSLAVAAAVVASFSSAQGLAVWPAGLVFLVAREQPRRRCWWWVACGCGAALLYLLGFSWSGSGGGASWAVAHPLATAKFLVQLLGAVLPVSRRLMVTGTVQEVVGLALWLLALGLFCYWLRNRSHRGWLSLPLALVAFGAVIDVLITLGRAHTAALNGAGSSRYIAFNLWMLLGLATGYGLLLGRAHGRRLIAGMAVVAVLCAFQVALSYHSGLLLGASTHRLRERAASLVTSYCRAPRSEVVSLVDPDYGAFRQLAPMLQHHRLSVFADQPPAAVTASGACGSGARAPSN